jgi:hypothetical protein
MNEKEFREMYLGVFIPDPSLPTQYYCGQCIYFDGKCTTSLLEAKYGSGKTPACSEFEMKKEYND